MISDGAFGSYSNPQGWTWFKGEHMTWIVSSIPHVSASWNNSVVQVKYTNPNDDDLLPHGWRSICVVHSLVLRTRREKVCFWFRMKMCCLPACTSRGRKSCYFWIKSSARRAFGGCLGSKRRWKTWYSAISHGELRISFDPWISEWGNPPDILL